ncbi:DUF1015 domain-containing protein [Thermodesulfobacteriota bacterium]
MAVIAPFRGLRYNLEKISCMEEIVTPPYDVIDESGKCGFLAKNPYNVIKLDLSKCSAAMPLTDDRYTEAKKTFDGWQDEGVLNRDEVPCFYLYQIEYYHPSGSTLIRKGFVSLVQLAEFSEGIVKPHEKTFRDVTTDRLHLLEACKTNFSKIFALYPDPTGEVNAALDSAGAQAPLLSVKDQDGNTHTIWGVTDPQTISTVRNLLNEKAIYIADGHHRYTTALQFREVMKEKLGAVAENSPYNYVMMYLCGMEDPGLSVLPTHRLVRYPGKISPDEVVDLLKTGFEVKEIKGGSREFLLGEVFAGMDEEKNGGGVFGFYHPDDRCFLLKIKPEEYAKTLEPDHQPALAELDVVMLADYLLGSLLDLGHEECESESLIEYYSDPDAALDEAVKESLASDTHTPLLFFTNATLVEQVKTIADQDLVMPHKSTYFYPKILTGLIMNKMVADETIE